MYFASPESFPGRAAASNLHLGQFISEDLAHFAQQFGYERVHDEAEQFWQVLSAAQAGDT
jgi:hypothetical protein